MNKLVSGAYAVELPISSTANKFYFPDIPQLRDKRIKHIETLSIPKSYSGKSIPAVGVAESFLTIVEQNTQSELISNINTLMLNNDGNKLFINKKVDYQQSYVTIPNTAGMDNKVLLFIFWYDEPTNRSYIPEHGNRTEMHSFELKLTAARTYFAENLILKDKKFQNIFFQLPVYSPKGNAGLSVFENKFITLVRNNVEFIKNLPLACLYEVGNSFYNRFQNIQFDFQSSYIDTLTTTADDLKTAFFNVIIDDNKQ